MKAIASRKDVVKDVVWETDLLWYEKAEKRRSPYKIPERENSEAFYGIFLLDNDLFVFELPSCDYADGARSALRWAALEAYKCKAHFREILPERVKRLLSAELPPGNRIPKALRNRLLAEASLRSL